MFKNNRDIFSVCYKKIVPCMHSNDQIFSFYVTLSLSSYKHFRKVMVPKDDRS